MATDAGVVLMVVVVAVAWEGPGDALGGGRLIAAVVYPLAALAALVVVVGAFNLCVAPVRVTNEQHAAYTAKLKGRDEQIAELTGQLESGAESDPRIVFKDRLDYQVTVGFEAARGNSVDYPNPDDWAYETFFFLQDAIGEAEAQTFARWVWGPKGSSRSPHHVMAIVRHLEPLQTRADDVALRRRFDSEKWSELGPVSDLPPPYRV